jgi:hypothetical protein
MGKKSSKSPDVKGAAETEGQYSRETARDVTYADRPDQIGPFGNVKWSTEQVTDPATGELVTKWSQNQSLAPGLQGAVDSSIGFMGQRSDLADNMMGRVGEEMGGAPDWAQFGDVAGFDPAAQRQAAEDAAYGKSTARMGDRFAKERNDMDIRMRNQGLTPGDQGYQAQMQNFMQGKNDAYEQARLGSVAEGRDEFGVALQGNERANALRNQQIQEYISKRGYSLEEANKLMEGQTAGELGSLISGEV